MRYQGLILIAVLTGVIQAVAAQSAQPNALELPRHWSVTPLMAPTNTLGLRIYSYVIDETEEEVLRWREQYMSSCRLPAVEQDDTDWHCLDAYNMYSLLWRQEGFIWVRSERLTPNSVNVADDISLSRLQDIDATVLSHSATAFESVTLFHSRRSLYALTQDLQRVHQRDGARLVFTEQNLGGFVQQWQAQQSRVTYTAQRDEQGDVLLVKVKGTTL